MDNVTISMNEYEALLADSRMLNALENAGVDNWEGYVFAIEEVNSE